MFFVDYAYQSITEGAKDAVVLSYVGYQTAAPFIVYEQNVITASILGNFLAGLGNSSINYIMKAPENMPIYGPFEENFFFKAGETTGGIFFHTLETNKTK